MPRPPWQRCTQPIRNHASGKGTPNIRIHAWAQTRMVSSPTTPLQDKQIPQTIHRGCGLCWCLDSLMQTSVTQTSLPVATHTGGLPEREGTRNVLPKPRRLTLLREHQYFTRTHTVVRSGKRPPSFPLCATIVPMHIILLPSSVQCHTTPRQHRQDTFGNRHGKIRRR